jgi:hypothetical protein
MELGLKLVKSPSRTSIDRKKQEGGKLQPINRGKMLKKISERYEKSETVIVELIRGLLQEICPLYDASYTQTPEIRPTLSEQI